MIRMDHSLAIEQTQKLIITPELRQAIAILQLSSQELSEYIEQELQNNPVLEISEESSEPPEKETADDSKEEEPFDVDWQEYFQDSSDLGYVASTTKLSRDEDYSYENFITKGQTIHEYLLDQLQLAITKQDEIRIGEFLIGCIDDNGYFRYPLQDIAKFLRKPEKEVLDILQVIQTFDPPGVGARNIKECLLIQLDQREGVDPLVRRVIEEFLIDLAENKCQKIANCLAVPPQRVQIIADYIRTLEPKPGRILAGSDDVRYITPDVTVERVNNEYVVIINDTSSPRLTVNSFYRNLLRDPRDEDGTGTKRFIENRLNSALWLIKSIEQRRMTLQRVVESIVEYQKEFLDKGIKHLRPLTLKQVADKIEVHESTVSRATSNKYVQTPQGVFELRFFFNSGLSQTEGENASAGSVKRMIEDLVKDENPQKPLSDQKIADILSSDGVMISRRTVAKYRDALGILPSSRRRRY